MLILGIETSCDDTCAAVVADGKTILSNIISSQIDAHQKFGGVVPEIASRKHVELINYVIQEALDSAHISFEHLDAIAVTCNHGLVGSLVVGVAAAKAIAYCWNLPLIGVHHIEGHVYANIVENPDIETPHICLTVSGGHTMLIYVQDHCKYELLGSTLDDAAGEAFDKIARFLGLGFPGGPIIDRLSQDGDPKAFAFPRPIIRRKDLDFSFSGLKTAVIYTVNDMRRRGTRLNLADIAASFQQAVVDVLVYKTIEAAKKKEVRTVTLAGGVAANSQLRSTFRACGVHEGLRIIYPSRSLCTDNAAMIAGLAFYKYRLGQLSKLDLDVMASAPLGA